MFKLHPNMYEALTDETLLARYVAFELRGVDNKQLADWYNRGLISNREYLSRLKEAQNADEITA